MENHIAYLKTPIGYAKIEGTAAGVVVISVVEEEGDTSKELPDSIEEAIKQLQEYFDGKRKEFDLKIAPKGTEFQQRVWQELLNIPYGSTRTYLEQTKKLGDVKAIRAVASANGKNPLWIVVPCHRVIGSDGSLTGYAGGVWRKKWLLEHESSTKQQSLF